MNFSFECVLYFVAAKPSMQNVAAQPSQNQPVSEELARAYGSLGLPLPSSSQTTGAQGAGGQTLPGTGQPGIKLPLGPGQAGLPGGAVNQQANLAQSLANNNLNSLAGVLGAPSTQPVSTGPSPSLLVSQLGLLGLPNNSTTLTGHQANIANTVASLTSAPNGPTDPSMTAVPNRQVKEWHKSVTQDMSNHMVHKL